MSKLIDSVFQCSERLEDRCTHLNRPKTDTPCSKDGKFPEWCPLQDGMPIPKSGSIEHSCGNAHKHTYYKNGKRVYLRRNRKNCIHYINGTMSWNRCMEKSFQSHAAAIYPVCKGVNCGKYQP